MMGLRVALGVLVMLAVPSALSDTVYRPPAADLFACGAVQAPPQPSTLSEVLDVVRAITPEPPKMVYRSIRDFLTNPQEPTADEVAWLCMVAK